MSIKLILLTPDPMCVTCPGCADQTSPDPSRVATIINIFLSKQKYFMINIWMSCRISSFLRRHEKSRPIFQKRIFSAPVTSQRRCQIVYEIKTNDCCVKCGNFVNFPLFCNYVLSFIWGNKKSINDVCKSFFRRSSCCERAAQLRGNSDNCFENKTFSRFLIKLRQITTARPRSHLMRRLMKLASLMTRSRMRII